MAAAQTGQVRVEQVIALTARDVKTANESIGKLSTEVAELSTKIDALTVTMADLSVIAMGIQSLVASISATDGTAADKRPAKTTASAKKPAARKTAAAKRDADPKTDDELRVEMMGKVTSSMYWFAYMWAFERDGLASLVDIEEVERAMADYVIKGKAPGVEFERSRGLKYWKENIAKDDELKKQFRALYTEYKSKADMNDDKGDAALDENTEE